MSIRECYELFGGDFNDCLRRIPSEAIITKYFIKFLSDGTMDLLCKSIEERKDLESFRAAHTIKGVSLNLGFTNLANSSSLLTEALRNGFSDNAIELFNNVRADYNKIVYAASYL